MGLAGGINTYAYVGGNPISDIDLYGLFDWPSLPQGVVDYSAGFGDTLSFGITNQIRKAMGTNDVVDKCSRAYGAGELSGIVLDIAIGGAMGLEASGTRGVGEEFSHWIPNRMGGPRSPWNGNYVSTARHYYQDPFRFPPGYENLGDKWSALLQQLDRIPYVYKGAAAGGAVGTASAANANCECSQRGQERRPQ